MAEFAYTMADDGAVTFTTTGHLYRIKSLGRGRPAVSLEHDGALLYAERLDLFDADARARFARVVSGRVPEATVAAELLALAGIMCTADETGDGTGGRAPTQAARLLALAADAELFHTPDGEAYATVPVAEHHETWRLRTKGFRQWLARRYYEADGSAANAQAMQDALGVLDARAVFDGAELSVHVRVAGAAGVHYLDLGNAAWECVEVTPDGWRVRREAPVKFRRPGGLLALPTPQPGGSLTELRPFLNDAGDDDFRLILSWLVMCLNPQGPYPLLALHGEQGSAKSTTARVLKRVVDPCAAPLRAEPRDTHEMMIAASNGWCIVYDNLSRLPDWLSDALCRLATGGGLSKRQLYTDAEEVIFDVMRPVIVTGIEEFVTRGDLQDRGLFSYKPAIPPDQRRPERAFWTAFEAAWPRILGALLDTAATALATLPCIRTGVLPRMADFTVWAMAAAPALGWTENDLLRAYSGNVDAANDLSLDAAPVAGPLRALFLTPWEGTATELLAYLNQHTDEPIRKQRGWPGSPRALSDALRRLAPNLRRAGLVVEFAKRPDRKRTRIIRLTPVSESSADSASDASGASAAGSGDGDAADAAPPSADAERHDYEPPASAARDDAEYDMDAADDSDAELRPDSAEADEAQTAACPECGMSLHPCGACYYCNYRPCRECGEPTGSANRPRCLHCDRPREGDE